MSRYFLLLLLAGCSVQQEEQVKSAFPANVLDYTAEVDKPTDRKALVFSDQGAWFGYSLPAENANFDGFVGPFLMTQENGKWLSSAFNRLRITNSKGEIFDWQNANQVTQSFSGHLEKIAESANLKVVQKLYFADENEAAILTYLTNRADYKETYSLVWHGRADLPGISLVVESNTLRIYSEKSSAVGTIVFGDETEKIITDSTAYEVRLRDLNLGPNEEKTVTLVQRFSFSETNSNQERQIDVEVELNKRIEEKNRQFESLRAQIDPRWKGSSYESLLAKALLTLQNNWRAPAGELKHSGLFPSYHYVWFHGFWAWDSWKHAVALAQYDTELAKDQIRAMYYFIDEDGFIPDCVYRDTTIEAHNYRNTKPPLSGWAISEIFNQDGDLEFIREMYPLLVRQHNWWYKFRDHDGDGICEYGSTDGTLKAAKWDSGMDNAVRFDNSKIVENAPGAYSLDQESVDLNAYLYAEKLILADFANKLGFAEDNQAFSERSSELAVRIQEQFYDEETGWFYDTNLDGTAFVSVMGCEGWIPLWAMVATEDQALAVRNNILLDSTFNTKVPLQTLAANHPKFTPDGGYWRGPTWLDQAYFGIRALKNYGYEEDANQLTYKLFHGAEGLLEKGPSIRENYQPITGAGLESENFSWSAAHYLLLLLDK